METSYTGSMPTACPACGTDLAITRLQCPACGTEVAGNFALSRLASLREPHASLLELFLRVRGNVKDMERALGLSYPTVRARLDEAFTAAGLDRPGAAAPQEPDNAGETEAAAQRAAVLDELEAGTITAAEAAARLRQLQQRRTS